jgi:hypothetical protein
MNAWAGIWTTGLAIYLDFSFVILHFKEKWVFFFVSTPCGQGVFKGKGM